MQKLNERKDKDLLKAFKIILKEKEYRSQDEIAYELSSRGFENISQSKVSRLLTKVGAIRSRNAHQKIIYQLPDEMIIPKVNYAIDSIALNVMNNGTQIIVKTGAGGASLIARMLDSLEGSFGIMGTIAGDDTVLVIPSDTKNIQRIESGISELFEMTSH
jgi:transcriptional regulator of arginine metabolism